MPKLFKVVLKLFFWMPFALALVDLAFYTLIPLLLVILLSGGTSQPSISEMISALQSMSGFSAVNTAIILVLTVLFTRVILTRLIEAFFSRSLSSYYASVTERLVKVFAEFSNKNQTVNYSEYRKAFSGELNNLFFGYYVPLSLLLAELLLLSLILTLAVYIIGIQFLGVVVVSGLILVIPLYILRNRAHLIGELRASSEKERGKYVEILLKNAFTITSNNGFTSYQNKLRSLSKNFSLSLSKQIVLPYTTKSVVEAVLVVIALSVGLGFQFELSPPEIALLTGMALRAFPSLSRLTSYLETIRVNQIAESELYNSFIGSEFSVVEPNQELLNSLKSFSGTGLLIIEGKTGAGKTTTLKHWVLNDLQDKKIVFLEQSTTLAELDLEEYMSLVGLSKQYLSSMQLSGSASFDHLSGGQSKLLQFKVLSEKTADIFIFDEPSVGLDASLREQLAKIICKLTNQSMVVVVTHDASFLEDLSNQDMKSSSIQMS